MAAPSPHLAAVRARIDGLGDERRAAFALACAERLVRQGSRARDLLDVLREAWDVAAGGPGDVDLPLAALHTRSDLDDDEVACVTFALQVVAGVDRERSLLWAVGRSLDAAYERGFDVHDQLADLERSAADAFAGPEAQEALRRLGATEGAEGAGGRGRRWGRRSGRGERGGRAGRGPARGAPSPMDPDGPEGLVRTTVIARELRWMGHAASILEDVADLAETCRLLREAAA